MRNIHLIYIIGIVLCITACTKKRPKEPSAGRPYEVFVTSTTGDTAAIAMVCRTLSLEVEALPQPEPQFDAVKMELADYQSAIKKKSTVLIDINRKKYHSPTVTWHTSDGTIHIFLNADSNESLANAIDSIGSIMREQLLRHEIAAAKDLLKTKHNPKAEQKVKDVTGVEMLIPADMQHSKQGEQFIWLSNDALTGMQSICVYSYPGLTLNAERALVMRDSVLGRNIEGETKDMHMTTTAQSVISQMMTNSGRKVLVQRGLWEMAGDAMGGPFVSRSYVDSANHRIVVKEAFVYAPERKKRNLIRQLEAAIMELGVRS